jgi:hypothetical protein
MSEAEGAHDDSGGGAAETAEEEDYEAMRTRQIQENQDALKKFGLVDSGAEFRSALVSASTSASRRVAVQRAPRNRVASRESARGKDKPRVTYTNEDMVEDEGGHMVPYREYVLKYGLGGGSSLSGLRAQGVRSHRREGGGAGSQ